MFDPPSGRRGEVGDVCIRDGRIVESLPVAAPVLEARGLVVMAGAIEMHTHVAGPAVGAARLLVTAQSERWATIAARTMTGFATSVIACGCEAGLEGPPPERAAAAIQRVPAVILPFPGGIVRSGSKVGSKYRKLIASTNSPYCPTLRRSVPTALPDDVAGTLEIVIDGLTIEDVKRATVLGVRAACGDGIARISAGNYGGRLGKHLIHLRPVLEEAAS